MKRFMSLLLVIILLGACAPAVAPAAPAGPITLTDGAGKEISLAAPATKIVSLAPSNTEILFAIGAGGLLVGRDDFSNFPEDGVKDVAAVGGLDGKLNLEKITSLQPDLVLAAEINTPDQIKALEDLGLKVVTLKNPTEWTGLYENIKLVGKTTGQDAAAEKLAADLAARVKAVADKVATVTSKPILFYELDATEPAKPWTTGPGTFMDLLINQAGGVNAAAGMGSPWGQLSQEELIVQNPDFILLGDNLYGGVTPEQVAARPGWDAIKAVQQKQVFAFNDDLVSRPGPRLVDGLEAVAKTLHPDLFK